MALSKRSQRWLMGLSGIVIALVVGAWWVDRQLEPHRLTTIILGRLGPSLKLELDYSGDPDYALKPEPRLVLPNLVVRNPADDAAFLIAKRVEISLPWATLTGGEPVITRIDLDQPELDLPGLRRWLASRPKTPFRLPTLINGLYVSKGTLRDEGFSVRHIELTLPHLRTGDAANAKLAGVFEKNQTKVIFTTTLSTPTPGLESDFTLTSRGELQHSPQPLPFKLSLAGRYRSDNVGFSVEAPALQLEAASPLPTLTGKTKLLLTQQLQLDFAGTLRRWPKDWPALPEPLASNIKPIDFQLVYLGKNDLSGPINLELTQEATQLQANLRIDEMQQWTKHPPDSPLPPLNTRMHTPQLTLGTVVLDGVEIEIRDDLSTNSNSN